MASITYNGVAVAEGEQGSGGGNIFKNVKFWIAQRVPMRTDLINKVTQNQGVVVPLEKHADILIADHARKDAPPGSYSWRFILDSVEFGIIQLKDRYRIGPDPDRPRPVGAGSNARRTRVPFTKTDDAQLAKWMLTHETGNAMYQSGNLIYQEWEKLNPKHTWQSWRDHYIKKLRPLPRDQLERIAASAPDMPAASAEAEQAVPENEPQERHEESITVQQTHERSQRPARDGIAQSQVGAVADRSNQLARQAHSEEVLRDSDSDAVHQEEEKREMFYIDYATFLDIEEVKHRHITIDIWLVELYDLLVAADDCRLDTGDETHDWHRVADILELPCPGEIAKEVKLCYEEYLVEFLEGMATFDAASDAEIQGLVKDEDHTRNLADIEAHLPSSQLPQSYVRSSPPIGISGLKRAADSRPASSSGPQTKRHRFRRDTEIPSTPDVELGRIYPTGRTISRNHLRDDNIADSEASQQLPSLPDQTQRSIDLGTRAEQEQRSSRPGNKPRSVEDTPIQGNLAAPLDFSPIPFALSSRSPQKQTPASTSRQVTRAKHEIRAEPSTRSHGSHPGEAKFATQAKPSTATKPKPKPSTPRRSLPASFTSSRPAPRPKHTQEPESNSRQIQDWIAHYETLGYPRPIVVEGLQCTTLTPGPLAELVMKSLHEGRVVPTHHEGIWTARDDSDLNIMSKVEEMADATPRHLRAYQKIKSRLWKKHGKERAQLRREFLAAQHEENDEHTRG